MDDRQGFDHSDGADLDSVHGAGRVHPQHSAARARRRGPVRLRYRIWHRDSAGSDLDRARRRRRGGDCDLRRPGCPHHPRGNRRDAGARHRSHSPTRGAARSGVDVRGDAAQRSGDRDRPERRLRILRAAAGCEPRGVHQRLDHPDRVGRVGDFRSQGPAVRCHGGARRLLPRPHRQGRTQGRRRSCQRDRHLCLHLPVRDQCAHDGDRHPGAGK